MRNDGKPILIGYDGSEASKRALRWALEEADRWKVDVTVLNAEFPDLVHNGTGMAYYDPAVDPRLDRGDELLSEAAALAETWAPGVKVNRLLATTGPAIALLDSMDDASMVVVGSRGHNALHKFLIGSTSLHVATHGSVPVVVLREYETTDDGPEAGRVVVGVDASGSSSEALRCAFEEAQLRGAGLTAIRAWHSDYLEARGPRVGAMPVPLNTDLIVEEETADLAREVHEWAAKFPEVDVRQRAVPGRAADVLVEEARGADLLVIGSRGRGGFRSLLLGSVGHAVIRHATGPVMIVRPHSSD